MDKLSTTRNRACAGSSPAHIHQFQCGMTERPSNLMRKCMTLGPSHYPLNQRQGEMLYGVRSTGGAENPQVACDWSGATLCSRVD